MHANTGDSGSLVLIAETGDCISAQLLLLKSDFLETCALMASLCQALPHVSCCDCVTCFIMACVRCLL